MTTSPVVHPVLGGPAHHLLSPKRALQVVFGISLVGVAFSGTLTWRELVSHTALSCPSPGEAGTILGYPACVYGLIMYAIIATVSGLGLRATK